MAHIAKYKAPSVGHMLAHYRRDRSSLERDNIDPERIKNDLVVGHYTHKDGQLVVGRVAPREGEPNWGTGKRRIERVNEAQKAAGKRATRKDAVVMADVVVTLPDNVRKGDEDRFFRLTYWYLSNKFGIDNMMGGYVHKDEVLKDGTPARDHMHVPFTYSRWAFQLQENVPALVLPVDAQGAWGLPREAHGLPPCNRA